ncbi:Magnesium and cobalt efflux protein CorC [Fundidesulfovibrio magnetotacticus]|uniref:Magnesium and cobalt efflux protein CorC n=1 Tax=Fundidesulfovibrio magnetotacticus TaxID=2730080 RepID=A0A6V8LZE4_9BACT|nr:hemolysin family protein [Fundidesulfovibrio magnetotacticus]GFK95156.1 Magnesium and cobalt efflux protein CorC [Fundidesulfovibrio magnetotacticus]
MEEGPEGRFWSLFTRLFKGRDDLPLAELIESAQQDGEIKPEDALVLLKVLKLGEKQVADIMVPRTDMVCADEEDGVAEVTRLIVEHGHSRIPVYRENRDHILGVVHAKDLLRFLMDASAPPPPLARVMRKPLYIPETKNLREMLAEFQRARIHIAVALDEYGGTSGLVTLEDVLEEIVGEIEDEHDPTRPAEFQELENGSYRFHGRFPLEELAERFGIELNSDQVETLGGYLSDLAGRVPRPGESFEAAGRRFTVVEADRRQVRWVLAEPLPEEPGGDELPA